MLFKEVWQFGGTGGISWNEVYYSTQVSLAAASEFAPVFLVSRTTLLSDLCTFKKIRISGVLDPSLHTLVNINRKGDALTAPANQGEALVITLSSSVQPGTRKLWMRGTVENACARSGITGRPILDPAFGENLKDFIAQLAVFNYVVLSKKQGAINGVPKVRVLVVNGVAGDGTSTITTAVTALLLGDDTVTMSGFDERVFPGLNGNYRVLSVDGLTFKIQYRTVNDILIETTQGKAQRLQYWETAKIDPKISGFSYLGTRQTKNVDTGSVGARRARSLRS